MSKFLLCAAALIATTLAHPWDLMAAFQGDVLGLPTVNSQFCTTMTDDLYQGGAKTPAQSLVYGLCIDLKNTRWTHTVDDATFIFNGTNGTTATLQL